MSLSALSILALFFGSLLFVLLSGLPVAFAFMLVNILGYLLFVGGVDSLNLLVGSAFESVATFPLVPVPFFILMGDLLLRSGLARLAIDAVDLWIGRWPGRLGVVTIGAGAIFGALCGSSLATTATFAATLTPEMERRGYKPEISVASVLAAGGLAVLIPPSTLAVLLAVLAKVSVAKLLIASIVPGLILAVIYALYFPLRVFVQPHLAPRSEAVHPTLLAKLRSLAHLAPLVLLMTVVTGFIFLGIATPSETAAMGALGALLLTAGYGRLSMTLLRECLLSTAKITAMILLIIVGSTAYVQLLAISGLAAQFVEFATQVDVAPIIKIGTMIIIVLILGCFVDSISIMLITVPIFIPVVLGLGMDPVWFAVIILINLELAAITPPFGLQLLIVKGVCPHLAISEIFGVALPIVVIQVLLIAVLVMFPSVVAWLPSFMIARQ